MRKVLNFLRQSFGSLLPTADRSDGSVQGALVRIGSDLRSRPGIIRHGLDAGDKTPFYTMDRAKLTRWFPGYAQSEEYRQHLLYAETVAFISDGMRPIITEPAVDIADLRIRIEPTRFQVPLGLHPHRDAMLDFFKQTGRLRQIGPAGEWENNRTARLCAFDPAEALMVLQEASYFDQVATNISVDTDSGKLPSGMLTIRRGFEPPSQGRLVPLSKSGMANTLGVAGVLFARDGQPLMRERSQWLGSINQAKIHCSVSGVYELPPDSRRGGEYDFELLRYGIELEVRQELNLEPGEYKLYPIALSRELPRHGKPQLFFAVFCDIPAIEMVERLRNAEESYEFLNDPNFMFKVDEVRHDTYERFTYEGWAALNYALKFIDANDDKLEFAPALNRR